MIDFFLKGGILMWPILFCSISSVAIILERFYYFNKVKPKLPNLFSRVRNLLKQQKHDEALKLCDSLSDPITHILAIGIRIRKKSFEERERIINQAATKVVRGLEKNLNFLAIIANVTPLMGLLGTVTGMIKAFIKIQHLQGTVDISVLAQGIWEALITTAFGLSVAIPTVIFYHFFEDKADNIINDIKDISTEFFEVDSTSMK